MTQQTSLFTLADIPRKKDDYELGKYIGNLTRTPIEKIAVFREFSSKTLRLSANDFLDFTLTALTKEVKVDVVKLDELLTARHKEFSGSLSELLLKYYGEEANKKIEEAL